MMLRRRPFLGFFSSGWSPGRVRLLETCCPAGNRRRSKKAQKKAVAEAKEQTIKLAIRLNEGINEVLRTLIRYRGVFTRWRWRLSMPWTSHGPP